MNIDRVLVIGGGIGGLTLALALQQRGIDVSVYEKARELKEIGAGIILQPNGRKGLVSLGVDQAVADVSCNMPIRHGCDYATGEILTAKSTAAQAAKYGLPPLAVHRGDLHSVLLQAVLRNDPDAVHASYECVGVEQDADEVRVQFANGACERGAIVVGADGNGSAVRTAVFPGEEVRFNGQVAFRAIIPMEDVPPIIQDLQLAMYCGPDRYMLHYPLQRGTVMNLIGCGRTDSWEDEGWAIPASKDQFRAAYSDFAPHLLELIDKVPTDDFYKWGLYDRDPLETWVKGRIAIMGDAAHPMTPFLGQGASMAIEDGIVLARALAEIDTIPDALACFENTRRDRGNNVARWSWQEGRALQDPSIPRVEAEGYGLLEYDPSTEPLVH